MSQETKSQTLLLWNKYNSMAIWVKRAIIPERRGMESALALNVRSSLIFQSDRKKVPRLSVD